MQKQRTPLSQPSNARAETERRGGEGRARAMSSSSRSEAELKKEAHAFGLDMKNTTLTPQMIALLDRIRDLDKEPPTIVPPGSRRSAEEQDASVEIHKRVNPGYVEMPYKAKTAMDFVYKPPPDFSRAYLKKKSDCDFQGYANTAILLHVDLKKTSH